MARCLQKRFFGDGGLEYNGMLSTIRKLLGLCKPLREMSVGEVGSTSRKSIQCLFFMASTVHRGSGVTVGFLSKALSMRTRGWGKANPLCLTYCLVSAK